MQALPEDYTIKISIDSYDFKHFSYFHTFYNLRSYRRPLLFFALLCAFGVLCLAPVLRGGPVPLPAIVLLSIAVLIPLAYFLQFGLSVRDQCKTLHLYSPREVYTLRFSSDSFYAAPLGQQAIRAPWSELWHAYRTKYGIYIYVNPQRAFIVPPQASSDAIWATLEQKLDPSRCTRK